MVQINKKEHEELVIKKLGEYMLGGWVLTENTCEECLQVSQRNIC